jgi:hypothetical protein
MIGTPIKNHMLEIGLDSHMNVVAVVDRTLIGTLIGGSLATQRLNEIQFLLDVCSKHLKSGHGKRILRVTPVPAMTFQLEESQAGIVELEVGLTLDQALAVDGVTVAKPAKAESIYGVVEHGRDKYVPTSKIGHIPKGVECKDSYNGEVYISDGKGGRQ